MTARLPEEGRVAINNVSVGDMAKETGLAQKGVIGVIGCEVVYSKSGHDSSDPQGMLVKRGTTVFGFSTLEKVASNGRVFDPTAPVVGTRRHGEFVRPGNLVPPEVEYGKGASAPPGPSQTAGQILKESEERLNPIAPSE